MFQVREMRIRRMISLTLVVVTFCGLGYGRTIRVGNDPSADYPTIQAAIDDASEGDTVLVARGTYTGDGNRDIDFKGKAITVKSEAGPRTCIIDSQGSSKAWRRGFYFHSGEQADSVLDGLTITGGIQYIYSGGGILCSESSPTIRNCVIVGNAAPEGGGLALDGSAVVSNCIIAGNRTLSVGTAHQIGGALVCDGDGHVILRNCTLYANRARSGGGGVEAGLGRNGKLSLVNCILFGNRSTNGGNQISRAPTNMVVPAIGVEIGNCLIEDDPNALGGSVHLSDLIDCIWGDPLFANPGHWDSDLTPTSWIDGDYHLQSQAGRWDPNSVSWVQDDLTSPCIDAGDPNTPIGGEPFPNGGRINMGAYGGTGGASKSPSGLHARYGGGAGEPNDPYLIYTAAQFKAIGANPDDWDRHFRLMADVDLGGSEANDVHVIGYWRSWEDCKPFRGSFDGNGHRILHFTWHSTGRDRVGLFGYIAGAASHLKPTPTIKDLGLIDPDVEAGTGDDVGALVGYFVDAAFSGCYVEGGRVSGDKHVGGLMGGTMDCVILSSIPQLDIRNCRATAQVSGTEAVGGLIGYYGGVTWRPTPPFASYYEISGCCAAGEVTGTTQVGGLAGFVDGGRIFDCYSQSLVSGDSLVGGLIGISHAEVATCYAAGKVEGTAETGGLIGSVTAGGVIPELEVPIRTNNSFWDVEASGQTASAGGEGKTTVEMQTARTFLDAGWDFIGETTNGTAEVWSISEGQDYPHLSWQPGAEQKGSGD